MFQLYTYDIPPAGEVRKIGITPCYLELWRHSYDSNNQLLQVVKDNQLTYMYAGENILSLA